MNFTDGVWALEYARGSIWRSMPFGLADEILSCRDFLAVKQTVAIYATLIGRDWSAPYSRGLLKRLAGGLLKSVGGRITARLVPPPPRELSRSGGPAAIQRAAPKPAASKRAAPRPAARQRSNRRSA